MISYVCGLSVYEKSHSSGCKERKEFIMHSLNELAVGMLNETRAQKVNAIDTRAIAVFILSLLSAVGPGIRTGSTILFKVVLLFVFFRLFRNERTEIVFFLNFF